MTLIAASLVLFALVLLPGLHLVRQREWEREDALELLTSGLIGGCAFWAIAIWWIPPGALDAVVLAVASLGAAGWALPGRRARLRAAARRLGAARRLTVLLLGAALGTLALRALLVAVRPPPSVGDLTMHAYMAELIALHGGMPPSHEPLLPISSFGQNSPGLHALAAIVTRLTGMPTYQTVLLAGAFGLALIGLGLDRALRALWPGAPRLARALAALSVPLLARNPQLYVTWGGVPTLLADALVIYVLAEAIELVREPEGLRAARAGLVAGGTVLVHMLPALAGIWVIGALVLLALWRRYRASEAGLGRVALRGLLALGVALAAVAPFVRLTALRPDSRIVEWARGWIRTELGHAAVLDRPLLGWTGLVGDVRWLLQLPLYWVVFVGVLLTLLVGGWAALRLFRGRPSHLVDALVVLGVLGVLHAASIYEFLPYWMGLYPSRIHVFLLVPAGLAALEGWDWLLRRRGRLVALAVVCLLSLAVELPRMGPLGDDDHGGGVLGACLRTYCDRVNARVTEDDLRAMRWLREHTAPDAVVANNPADGGHLIPAVAHRKITDPHYQFFWYRHEMEAWRARTRPRYVFVGARPSPGYPVRYRAAELDRDPRARLVFRSGEARIYELREPAGPPAAAQSWGQSPP